MNHYCRLIGSNILIRWTFYKTVNYDKTSEKAVMIWKIVKARGKDWRDMYLYHRCNNANKKPPRAENNGS